MSLLPPIDIFEEGNKIPNKRIDDYIEESINVLNAKSRDIETARRIRGNLTYLSHKSDADLKNSLRMEHSLCFSDPVYKKLTECDYMLNDFNPFRVFNIRELFKDMRNEMVNRKMDEFTYGYLNETSVEDIVNDHLPPILEDYSKNHNFAKLITGALLMAEKTYRGVKK